MTNALTVGFIGVGRMGWPMARNIAAAGFTTWVYDADRARAERLLGVGVGERVEILL